MTTALDLGLDTFGDVTAGPDGTLLPQAQVLRDLVEEAVLAEEVGVDFFGIGEHHRADFAVSSPETVLAAIAGRTRSIRLGSAVTVLSSDDPVRVYQRFATLDAVSGGRAEAILGRGSFTESFPLFGLPLEAYETLFSEKLDLFARLLAGGPVTWSGTVRAPLVAQGVFPQADPPFRTWIGVGGSPNSVIRAAQYGLPLMLAIIGGEPGRFRAFVDLSARAFAEIGRPMQAVGVHSPGHVGETDAEAREAYFGPYKAMRDRIGAERGWPPMGRAEFEREAEQGSLYVGSPESVARRIAQTVRTLGLSRFQMKYSAGPLPHGAMMRSIELYGRRVVPLVRDMLA